MTTLRSIVSFSTSTLGVSVPLTILFLFSGLCFVLFCSFVNDTGQLCEYFRYNVIIYDN